jgi:ActR/RegA family two-component response regulator
MTSFATSVLPIQPQTQQYRRPNDVDEGVEDALAEDLSWGRAAQLMREAEHNGSEARRQCGLHRGGATVHERV